jgi:predicted dehydrogenase
MNPTGNKIWRGGMIGAGAWSDVQLAAWSGVKHAHIVALCDRHPERRDPLARRWEIPAVFGDFETMLAGARLDFVDICTRPPSHAGLIRQAVARGLPILCQKPFATTLDEARELVGLCEQAGVRLMINENYRWQGWFRQVRELLVAGRLGRPFNARMVRRIRFTLPRFDHAQSYLARMEQLLVYEMGSHWLDVFRYLFGEPQTVYARLQKISPQVQGEDLALLVLGYKDLTCTIENSWASVPIPGIDQLPGDKTGAARLEIEGTEGTLSLACNGTLHLYTDTDHERWHLPEDTLARSHVAAQQHFIDHLVSGAEFETSGAAMLKTMALIQAAYVSAAENRVVEMAGFLPLQR